MSERKNYFVYSAAGSAFGGVITSPVPKTVPTGGMVSLSSAGGYGTSTVEYFGIEGLLSVGKATSTVSGDGEQTEVTISLEDVSVRNVVTVARIVMHLKSQQVPLGAREAYIDPDGSTMEGLQVYGKDVLPPCSTGVFAAYPSYSGLEAAYVEGKLQGLIIEPGTLGAPCTAKTLDGCETKAGDVRATLYSLQNYSGGLPVVNGGLRIKDFGTLYLGQYRITKFARRLTMLRIELGCDTGGRFDMGDGSGNGHWEPPD